MDDGGSGAQTGTLTARPCRRYLGCQAWPALVARRSPRRYGGESLDDGRRQVASHPTHARKRATRSTPPPSMPTISTPFAPYRWTTGISTTVIAPVGPDTWRFEPPKIAARPPATIAVINPGEHPGPTPPRKRARAEELLRPRSGQLSDSVVGHEDPAFQSDLLGSKARARAARTCTRQRVARSAERNSARSSP